MWLLQHCTTADSLAVDIASFETPGLSLEGHQDTKEMISCVPLLHNITNLTIHVDAGRWHELKATTARLVTKCSGVQRLSIDSDCANDTCSKAGCLSNLEDDPTISLEHLREARITGFPSSMYHKSLLQLMITGAPALEKMTPQAPSKIVGLNYDDGHVLHALALRFVVTPNPFGAGTGLKDTEDGRRLIAAVDAALALRAGSGRDVEELEINFVYSSPRNRYIDMASGGLYLFRHGHAAGITSAHVAAWLRFGERRVTRRFTLAVPVLPRHASKTPAAAALPERKLYAEMPASARSETMSLTLGNAALAVPVAGAGAFHALADLLLSHARIVPASAGKRNLGRLLSATSCPRLRRLWLEHIAGLAALRLRATAALEELRLDHVRDMSALELDAPGLRALHVAGCYKMASDDAAVAGDAGVRDVCRPDRLRFDGAATVRRLDKIFLWSHGRPDVYSNAGAVWLLQHFAAANSLGVRISPPVDLKAKNWKDTEEMMSPVPHLPNITSLTIDAQWQHLEASTAKLISKCGRLERLSIDISRPSSPALERMTVELYIGKELDCGSIPCNRGRWAPFAGGQSSTRVCSEPGKKVTEGQLVVYPEKRSLHPLLFCSKTSRVLLRKRSNQDL
ncbi:hypothetical protein GQ55_3G422200 [Panicum hallii var. hallii]|uniref:FBD domain-containing protein n=1 Tax=Panicum hallii var. hallii TaxID=1504633 RepID=A0A2T7EHH6_9POAL|nr:hypothetical protein GQ55_3G422200 [Panicum hallii var. hallii]